jgi:hypothetical protein
MAKIIEKILIALAAIIAIPFVVALFVNKNFVVDREIIINKPKAEVFDYTKHLKNQLNYSKWFSIDPQMKTRYTGTDGTVGFVMRWASNNQDVGKGEQEIKDIKEGDRIDVEIRMFEPFRSTDAAYTTTEAVAQNQTRVKWVYLGNTPYPMNLLGCLCMNKIGENIETGLLNLKNILEGR